MRKINKGEPYAAFSVYMAKNNPKVWKELDGITYDMRVYMLCYEQDCLCGYSEIPIEAENTKSHIDHFVKQEYDSKKIFDWNNLIVSTTDEDFGGKYKDNTYKIKKDDYSQIYNPVADDMSLYIEYSGDGSIIPAAGISVQDKEKVKKTVQVFNLNCTSLRKRRKLLLYNLQMCSGVPQDEIRHQYEKDGFISVINWFFKAS